MLFFPSVGVLIELHINSVRRLFGYTSITVWKVSASILFDCSCV